MKNIYLIGMPGCGKSTIGQIISKKLSKSFLDLDKYIVESTGETIEQMFEKGEKYFRARETAYLKNASKLENMVIATGGGIVETEENLRILKNSGSVIFIDTPPDNIIANSSLEGRPLLADNKNKIFDLYKRRYNLYIKFSDITVENCCGIEEVVSDIIELIK